MEPHASTEPNAAAGPPEDAAATLSLIKDRGVAPEETVKELNRYSVGDYLAGVKITHIYRSNKNFLICRNESGEIGYRVKSANDPKVARVLNEFERWGREYRSQLRGVFKPDFTNLIASCMASALTSAYSNNDGGDVKAHFEPMASFIAERGPIEYVYGYGSDFRVFLSKRGLVTYEHRQLPPRLIPAIEEFHRLQHIARASLQEADKREVTSILGADLANLFRSPESADPSLFFFSSKDFITNRSEALLRSKYIRSSVLSALAGLIIFTPAIYVMQQYSMEAWLILLGCVGGIIGATISIIQRGVTLTVNPFVPVSHVAFQGIVRVFLGVVFGSLLIVAAKANIALGLLNDNIWSLFIFSVVAGFSERFIPDILDRIATQSAGAERK